MPYIQKRPKMIPVRKNQLTLISKGAQLKGLMYCWYINPMFPDVITPIRIDIIAESSIADIVRRIEQGRIYVRKGEI